MLFYLRKQSIANFRRGFYKLHNFWNLVPTPRGVKSAVASEKLSARNTSTFLIGITLSFLDFLRNGKILLKP